MLTATAGQLDPDGDSPQGSCAESILQSSIPNSYTMLHSALDKRDKMKFLFLPMVSNYVLSLSETKLPSNLAEATPTH